MAAAKENGTAKEEGPEVAAEDKAAAPPALPADVRQKLKKLERLEPKYSGMVEFWYLL
jgi:hypothetical protein